MTSSDYRAVAEAFRDSWPSITYPDDSARAQRLQWAADVRQVAKALTINNARFDQTLFEEACGHYDYMHGKKE